eukprot:165584_1
MNDNSNPIDTTADSNPLKKSRKLDQKRQIKWSEFDYKNIMVLDYLHANNSHKSVDSDMLKGILMSLIIDNVKEVESILLKLQNEELVQEHNGKISFTNYGLEQFKELMKHENKCVKLRDNYNQTHVDKITKVDGDGNCLFNSLTEQIFPNARQDGPLILRNKCVDFMQDNPNTFKHLYESDNANMASLQLKSFDRWLSDHRKNGVFDQNGILFIISAMALLNAPIQIRNLNDKIIFPNDWNMSTGGSELHAELIRTKLFDGNMQPILLNCDTTIKLIMYFDHYEPIINQQFNSDHLLYNTNANSTELISILKRIYNDDNAFTNLHKHAKELKESLMACNNDINSDNEDVDMDSSSHQAHKASSIDEHQHNENVDDNIEEKQKPAHGANNNKPRPTKPRITPRTNTYSVEKFKNCLKHIMMTRAVEITEGNSIALECGVPLRSVSNIMSTVKRKMQREGTFLSKQIQDDDYLHRLNSNDSVQLIMRHSLNSDFRYSHSNLFNHKDEKTFIR